MTEMDLIKIIFFLEICRMTYKCFKRFPREYISEKFYLLEYVISYLSLIISFLVLLKIEMIARIFQIEEARLFSYLCLAIGASSIGILQVIKKEAELNYVYHKQDLGKMYRVNIQRRNFLIAIEVIMFLIVVFLYQFIAKMD